MLPVTMGKRDYGKKGGADVNIIKRHAFQGSVVILLVIISLLCLLPFINILAKSFSAESLVVAGEITFIPKQFNWKAYELVFNSSRFLNAFKINVFITVVGTILNVLLTILAAYSLSRRYLAGRSLLMFLFVFTMLFSGGIIPTYLVIKWLGLINDLGALIYPALVAPFNMILMKNYFEAIPDSLEESAKIDGASNTRILFMIMVPLALPCIATITIFYAVAYWNEYFTALIYINKLELQPLQVYLRDIILNMDASSFANPELVSEVAKESVRGATIIVATLPIIIVYPFLQKYFVKGTIVGAVKE